MKEVTGEVFVNFFICLFYCCVCCICCICLCLFVCLFGWFQCTGGDWGLGRCKIFDRFCISLFVSLFLSLVDGDGSLIHLHEGGDRRGVWARGEFRRESAVASRCCSSFTFYILHFLFHILYFTFYILYFTFYILHFTLLALTLTLEHNPVSISLMDSMVILAIWKV